MICFNTHCETGHMPVLPKVSSTSDIIIWRMSAARAAVVSSRCGIELWCPDSVEFSLCKPKCQMMCSPAIRRAPSVSNDTVPYCGGITKNVKLRCRIRGTRCGNPPWDFNFFKFIDLLLPFLKFFQEGRWQIFIPSFKFLCGPLENCLSHQKERCHKPHWVKT